MSFQKLSFWDTQCKEYNEDLTESPPTAFFVENMTEHLNEPRALNALTRKVDPVLVVLHCFNMLNVIAPY